MRPCDGAARYRSPIRAIRRSWRAHLDTASNLNTCRNGPGSMATQPCSVVSLDEFYIV